MIGLSRTLGQESPGLLKDNLSPSPEVNDCDSRDDKLISIGMIAVISRTGTMMTRVFK